MPGYSIRARFVGSAWTGIIASELSLPSFPLVEFGISHRGLTRDESEMVQIGVACRDPIRWGVPLRGSGWSPVVFVGHG